MEYRELRQNNEIFGYVEAIWRREQKCPSWFVLANKVWTPTLESYFDFVSECQEVYGFFDGEKLSAVVYFEKQDDPRVVLIHLSVLGDLDKEKFIAAATKLRHELAHRGVKRIRGWVFIRNFALVKALTKIGFRHTGNRIDQGIDGRLLKWELLEIPFTV